MQDKSTIEPSEMPLGEPHALQEPKTSDSGGIEGYFLAFRIGDRQLAFPLDKVERVIRMVALVPVPEAPDWISGLINLQGKVMPVITLRKRLGLPLKTAELDHRILIMHTRNRRLGVIAEDVEEVMAVSRRHLAKPEGALKKSPLLNAVVRKNNVVYLVLEVDQIDTGALIEFEEHLVD